MRLDSVEEVFVSGSVTNLKKKTRLTIGSHPSAKERGEALGHGYLGRGNAASQLDRAARLLGQPTDTSKVAGKKKTRAVSHWAAGLAAR